MSDALIPEEASILAGVPVEQLKRWAWEHVGPKNIGTRWKPKYREEDVMAWRNANSNDSSERLASSTVPDAGVASLGAGNKPLALGLAPTRR